MILGLYIYSIIFLLIFDYFILIKALNITCRKGKRFSKIIIFLFLGILSPILTTSKRQGKFLNVSNTIVKVAFIGKLTN